LNGKKIRGQASKKYRHPHASQGQRNFPSTQYPSFPVHRRRAKPYS
jgi:hypothetical protein